MTHFGVVCPSATGHLNTMLPLGQELKKRGHLVTLLCFLDAKEKVLAAGLEFHGIGEAEFPLGKVKDFHTQLGKLTGLRATQYLQQWAVALAEIYFREAPEVIKKLGIEALLIDQVDSAGNVIAEYLQIPFVNVCSAIIQNMEITIPPVNTTWNYDPSRQGIWRNREGYNLKAQSQVPLRNLIKFQRQHWNLPPIKNPYDIYSKLAQISQFPAELEFPRRHLPKHFHFTGPFHSSESRKPVPFPYEKLTGQPLIYASLGTIANRLLWVFLMIAEACAQLDVQLVISLGGGYAPESLPELPGNPLVVAYAPQLELLQKATLTITHAGANTVLESLTNGVPMVAIPIVNDEPGIAARVAWAGVGEMIPLEQLSLELLRNAVQRVLTEESYKKNALRLQEAIRRAGGVTRAADIIEQAILTGKPVLAKDT